MQPLRGTIQNFLRSLTELPYDPAVPFLDVYPDTRVCGRYWHGQVPNGVIRGSLQVEVTPVSTGRWVDKANAA